jgi:flagellar protein FliL
MVANVNPPRVSPESTGRETDEGVRSKPVPSSAGGSSLGPWLPLLLNLLLLPLLAYFTSRWVLLPKIEREIARVAGAPAGKPADSALDEKGVPTGGPATPGDKTKVTAPLSGKVLVNVAGTQGTRYLLASIVLVGAEPNLKSLVDAADAQLRDAASSILSSKAIADLEKPGSRNLIRSELVSAFNNILGHGLVKEIYLTEFAIQ